MNANWPTRWAAIALALIALCLLPTLYRKHCIQRAERQLHELRRTQQPLPRQFEKIAELAELGVVHLANGDDLKQLRDQLDWQRAGCERRLRQIDSTKERTAEQATQREFEKGLDLYLLDRLSEAESILHKIAPNHLRASLLLAVITQDRERWAASDRWFEHTIKLGGESPDKNLGVLARMQAFDGLAVNARHERRYADAEKVYRRAMLEVEPAKAYFHFQLGRHYMEGGRSVEALAELRIAQELDPTNVGKKAAKLIDELRRSTPGCVLSPR